MVMNTYFCLVLCLVLAQGIPTARNSRTFHWDGRDAQDLFKASSLQEAKITNADRAALAKAIEAYIGPPDPLHPGMASEDQVKRAVLNAKIRMVHLNQGEEGRPEAVAQIQDFCSPVGNCSLWFFQRTPQGYKLLLDAIGPGFTIKKTTTNGFRDLVVAMHGSATEEGLKVYRYAHGRYWRVACYDSNSQVLEGDTVRELKEPRITPIRCGGK